MNCAKDPTKCKYRVLYTASLQSNALRIEIGWNIEKFRCGDQLKDGHIGGRPLDYKPCIKQ